MEQPTAGIKITNLRVEIAQVDPTTIYVHLNRGHMEGGTKLLIGYNLKTVLHVI